MHGFLFVLVFLLLFVSFFFRGACGIYVSTTWFVFVFVFVLYSIYGTNLRHRGYSSDKKRRPAETGTKMMGNGERRIGDGW